MEADHEEKTVPETESNKENEQEPEKGWTWMIGMDFKISVSPSINYGFEIFGSPPITWKTKKTGPYSWTVYKPTFDEHLDELFSKNMSESIIKARNSIIRHLFPSKDEMKSFPIIWGSIKFTDIMKSKRKDLIPQDTQIKSNLPEEIVFEILKFAIYLDCIDYATFRALAVRYTSFFGKHFLRFYEKTTNEKKDNEFSRSAKVAEREDEIYVYKHEDGDYAYLSPISEEEQTIKIISRTEKKNNLETFINYLSKIENFKAKKWFFETTPIYFLDF